MDKILIGIPVLSNINQLELCINALDLPAEILIINNNSSDVKFNEKLTALADAKKWTVLHQEKKLGTPASWNLIVRTGFAMDFEWVFIGSSDVVLHPGSLKAAVDYQKDEDVAIWHLYKDNFFLIRKRTINIVGWFDENLYLAYRGYQDYQYRCKLAGLRRLYLPSVDAESAATVATESGQDLIGMKKEDQRDNNYCCMKWGASWQNESFIRPFKNWRRGHRWWPQPGPNIVDCNWDGADLRRLALAFGTDKEGAHHYIKHYQFHFLPLRMAKLNILEIGVGGNQNPQTGGGSLRMWRAYFPNSHIFGIDINEKSSHEEKRIKTFKGDQIDEVFLADVVKEIGSIDIIIDDGSHYNSHVIKTFTILFPLLGQNGIYVVEDLQTSYWDRVASGNWGGSKDLAATHTSMNYFKRLVDGLNYEEFTLDNYTPSYFDRHIVSMHFYHNLIFIFKGLNNEGSNILGKRL